jgi:hypothetical protein
MPNNRNPFVHYPAVDGYRHYNAANLVATIQSEEVFRSIRAMRIFWNSSGVGKLGLFFCLIALSIYRSEAFAEDDHESQAVRKTIERSVPFIERKGAEWIASKDCLSCHHTGFMVWSLNSAKQAGVSIDKDSLGKWTEWAIDWRHLVAPTVRAEAKSEVTLPGHNDTIAQLLLGRAAVSAGANPPEWVSTYTRALTKGQQGDGSWRPGGQLPSQKRPLRETQEVTTMWALIALSGSHIQDDPLAEQRKKALAWLGDKTVGESTEWWATRTVLEQRLGNGDRTDHYRAELLKRQRADGGWGWLCKDDSDALGTGVALFALARDKRPATQRAIINARQFLARTQSSEGSWPVRGTKQNAKDRIEATSTYWGTCWAVIGLSESLAN